MVQGIAPLSAPRAGDTASRAEYTSFAKTTESTTPPAGAPEPSFRERLQAELARRCAANPQYSLRAFALDLDIDHASLSQLLRGKRALTETTIERLGQRLGCGAPELAAFVRRERLRGAVVGELATTQAIQTLSQYAAAIVTDWEHLALLELTHVASFRPDVGWIARVLGITTDAVTLALNRLLHLGLLVMEDERTWRDACGPTVFQNGRSDATAFGRAAARALAERLHALAPPPARGDLPQEHASMTIAVSCARVPEALERLRVLRAELVQLFAADAARDEVYRLDLRLYPLTRIPNEART
ncbi:MAG: TIGR02147 family protein [Planctomycetes bacterium]|nr:TIGR02147 family protein [Planctomycetota bacterium]